MVSNRLTLTREQLLELKGDLARSGIKHSDLAMRMGMTKSKLSRYLNGWTYMPEKTYRCIKNFASTVRRETKPANGRKVGPLWASL